MAIEVATDEEILELIEHLRTRKVRILPKDWRKGRQCPRCELDADQPKCFYDMGSSCPRLDPDNYDPSPYETVPDKTCKAAADNLERMLNERRNSPAGGGGTGSDGSEIPGH